MYNKSYTSYRLILKGIPYNVTKSDILNLFQDYKTNISEIILNIGHAFIDFNSESVLREAKEFITGKYIGNRPLIGKLFIQRPEYQYRISWRKETSTRHRHEN